MISVLPKEYAANPVPGVGEDFHGIPWWDNEARAEKERELRDSGQTFRGVRPVGFLVSGDWIAIQPLAMADDPAGPKFLEWVIGILSDHFDRGGIELRSVLSSWASYCRPKWNPSLVESLANLADRKRATRKARDAFDELLGEEPYSRETHLVPGLWRESRPLLIGGPLKACKSQIAMNLGVSLAHARPFMGMPAREWPRRVVLFSVEPGRKHLERLLMLQSGTPADDEPECYNAFAVPPEGGCVAIETRCPQLGASAARKALAGWLRYYKFDVAIFDPLYLLLPASVNVTDAPAVGRFLRAVTETCLSENVTPAFVCHSLKHVPPGRPMNLTDLWGAGVAEYARCWLLVNRELPFDPTRPGEHKLVVHAGSSDNQASLLRASISEATDYSSWSMECGPFAPASPVPANAPATPITLDPALPPRTSEAAAQIAQDKIREALAALSCREPDALVPRKRLAENAGIRSGSLVACALGRLQMRGEIEVFERAGRTRGKVHLVRRRAAYPPAC